MIQDRFYSFEIVDKFSAMSMRIFQGIILGFVIALALYRIYSFDIGDVLLFVAIYCVVFSIYVAFMNSKRKTKFLAIFKDKIILYTKKLGEISTQKEIFYSDIKTFLVSAGTTKKNSESKNPDPKKFSLRVFGTKTKIETKNNEVIEFEDDKADGVLVYSSNYIYRLLDIKRNNKGFNLCLENFNSNMDPESFDKQFDYYLKTGTMLPLFKNKEYIECLFKYAFMFAVIVFGISSFVAYILYKCIGCMDIAVKFIFVAIGIIAAVWFLILLFALLNVYIGKNANKKTGAMIDEIINS